MWLSLQSSAEQDLCLSLDGAALPVPRGTPAGSGLMFSLQAPRAALWLPFCSRHWVRRGPCPGGDPGRCPGRLPFPASEQLLPPLSALSFWNHLLIWSWASLHRALISYIVAKISLFFLEESQLWFSTLGLTLTSLPSCCSPAGAPPCPRNIPPPHQSFLFSLTKCAVTSHRPEDVKGSSFYCSHLLPLHRLCSLRPAFPGFVFSDVVSASATSWMRGHIGVLHLHMEKGSSLNVGFTESDLHTLIPGDAPRSVC